MAQEIATVTGTLRPEDMGRTLMHEHLLVGYPGWESDTVNPGPSRDEMRAVCGDRIAEIRDHGVTTMLDPCPADLGRDVEFMAEMAARTGFQIICATGLYKQSEGGAPYWHFRSNFGSVIEPMAELFEKELTEGIGETGIRAGIIKVATGTREITPYERDILTAAAKASVATGAPITTHTDQGTLGDAQQQLLSENGVPPHRIIVGHSCGTADHDYHMKIVRGGSYLGFDRFGLEMLQPDSERIRALLALLRAGATGHVVVSHDSVWCWRGQPFPKEIYAQVAELWNPSHFFERVIPALQEGGASEEQIERLLVANPRAFFAGEKPGA
ncbi:MAG: phosphotriesterase-related protein [Deltaproteobacteria bacterium]|jgi:phosphotriesterase-related protein|nr:phosphotriesterase-related protein [Deltaproteobacteria bacterium]